MYQPIGKYNAVITEKVENIVAVMKSEPVRALQEVLADREEGDEDRVAL